MTRGSQADHFFLCSASIFLSLVMYFITPSYLNKKCLSFHSFLLNGGSYQSPSDPRRMGKRGLEMLEDRDLRARLLQTPTR